MKIKVFLIMTKFLEETYIIDYSNNEIQKLAAILAVNCTSEIEVAQNCFEYVRDYIHHSGDEKNDITTCIASDVLRYKTGWCYSKSHLLAALLRANNIPTGFCYQRLSCSEYEEEKFCLHGLNAIYLKDYGWYRIDARGNKEDVNAQFNPPEEQLAFTLGNNEFDLPKIYEEPLDIVIKALVQNDTYSKMINNFPDIQINPTKNVEIHRATKNDSYELASMTGELLNEIMEKTNTNAFNFNEEETQKRAEDFLDKELYVVFVAKEENKYIGFISMYTSYALYSEGEYGTIPELYVKSEYRSLNIGQALLEKAKEFARSKGWKRLEVTTPPLPEFERTLSFYETNHFEISGGRKLKVDI